MTIEGIPKKAKKGICPKCGEELIEVLGLIRCKDPKGTCDYIKSNPIDKDLAAAKDLLREDHEGLLERISKVRQPKDNDEHTHIMADPSKDPMEDGEVKKNGLVSNNV